MNKSRKHVAWAGVGLALAVTAGSPALADDTELLVTNPGSTAAKPNILFILDSSGSMTTVENTQEQYITTNPYGGSCDRNSYYWTTGSNPPDCGTSNVFPKASFLCEVGIKATATSGLYTDTMTQYRGNNKKWRRLNSGNTSPVECKGDSGDHGNGTPGDVFARIGNNVSMFTNDINKEVAWGSKPTDRTYTVYDGNYLNWFHNSPVTSMRRTDIVKEVTKNVMGSISNVNVGFMQFHFEEGGPVTHAVKDLDSNRSEANNIVDKLPASGWTPLSETMYEAALYWRGQNAKYGQLSATDNDALTSSSPMNYRNPSEYACAKNFTVLLTDGAPTRDVGAYDKVPKLPGFTAEMGRSSCDGGNVNGACLDDISEYMSKVDINGNLPGDQTVTTYTIGFRVDLPILKDTAEKSGGEYYLAEDVKSLTVAITDIVTKIFDKDVSFTAPAVSVNAFNRTQHLNDLYISVFRASETAHWPGNLKKYTINKGTITDANTNPAVDPTTGFFADTSKSYWTGGSQPDGANVNAGGAASQLPDPNNRRLFTNRAGNDLSAAGNQISVQNAGAFALAEFGLTGGPGEPLKEDLIEWARGVDVHDEDDDPTTLVRRQMGDTLHSQPASIVYGGSVESPDVVVYAATNDGYVHAIDGTTGQELWSFIPHELLPNLIEFYNDDYAGYKTYGVDGDIVPVVADRNQNGTIEPGTDFVYLLFGMRRGGNNYYALDVTDKNAPKVKWIRSFSQMGQSWSSPVVAKLDIPGSGQSSSDKAVIVLGGGYDTVHDQASHPSTPDVEGSSLFMLDLETGAELWRAGADAGADLTLPKMTRAFPSRIRVLDLSGDGLADRMYSTDLGGQVWRFDLHSGKSPGAVAAGGVIARLGAEGLGSPGPADTRRFYNSPDVSVFHDTYHDKRYLSVNIGSGYRAHPLDKSAADRFYSLRDPNVFNSLSQVQYDAYPIVYDSSLIEVGGQFGVQLQQGDPGWKFTLPAGEKILAESSTFDDVVYFVSFEPQAASSDPCQAGLAVNRLYRVSITNGDPVVNTDELDPDDPEAADEARVTDLEQGGIAPKPTFLFPSPLDANCQGEECSPPPIGCVGVECFDPGFPNNPVRTLWTQDGVD